MEKRVTAWAEKITIPTYRIGEPDKNPMVLEKRVYQGSSGVVYPHPVIDRIYDEKLDQEYTALVLEKSISQDYGATRNWWACADGAG